MGAKSSDIIVFGEWDLWNVSQRCSTNAEFLEWVKASREMGLLPERYTDEYIQQFLSENDSIIAHRRFQEKQYAESLPDYHLGFEMGSGRSGVIVLDPRIHEEFLLSRHGPRTSEGKLDPEALWKAKRLVREVSSQLGWQTEDYGKTYSHPELGLRIEPEARQHSLGPFHPGKLRLQVDAGGSKETFVCISGLSQSEFQFFRDDNIAAMMYSCISDPKFVGHVCRSVPDYRRRLDEYNAR